MQRDADLLQFIKEPHQRRERWRNSRYLHSVLDHRVYGFAICIPDLAPRARRSLRRNTHSRFRETTDQAGVQAHQSHNDLETNLAIRVLGDLVFLLQVSNVIIKCNQLD
jgi:hypothetical protein